MGTGMGTRAPASALRSEQHVKDQGGHTCSEVACLRDQIWWEHAAGLRSSGAYLSVCHLWPDGF